MTNGYKHTIMKYYQVFVSNMVLITQRNKHMLSIYIYYQTQIIAKALLLECLAWYIFLIACQNSSFIVQYQFNKH